MPQKLENSIQELIWLFDMGLAENMGRIQPSFTSGYSNLVNSLALRTVLCMLVLMLFL